MGAVKKWVVESRAMVSILAVQVFATGLQLLSRAVLSEGTFVFALLAYRNVVAAICVVPFAFLWERGKAKELRWSILFWLFINALTGIQMAMGLFYYGLRDTTATYATNFLNLVPIATFVFSTIAGIEKLGLRRRSGKVKTLGAILCLAGALTISLYKGKAFHIGHHSAHQHLITKNTKPNWTRGTIFLVASVLSYAAWFIVQVKLFKVFPHKYWATFFTCFIASIQSVVMGLCLDREKAAWKLGWNLQLITIIYSGALATAATFCLISWAVANKGPTYPSMFNPLSLIFVAIIETLFLGQEITVGSLLGMLLIIVGLYLFLWGKSNKSKSMPPPKVADGEAPKADSDSAAMLFTAIVVPTASPSTNTAIVVPTASPSTNATIADKNQNEGALATAATFCLISWAVANKGPTYPSMFNPLSLIFVAIIETLFLGQEITVGSLLGMLLIIVGLYLFLWGKSNKSKSMPPPKVADGEAPKADSDSAAMLFTAIVVPTASPSTNTAIVVPTASPSTNATIADKNQNEAREI